MVVREVQAMFTFTGCATESCCLRIVSGVHVMFTFVCMRFRATCSIRTLLEHVRLCSQNVHAEIQSGSGSSQEPAFRARLDDTRNDG